MMKYKFVIAAIVSLGLSTPSFAKDDQFEIDCDFEWPRGTILDGDKFQETKMEFPQTQSKWRYTFSFYTKETGPRPADVVIKSSDDYASITGRYMLMKIAPNTYFSTAIRGGNCMFSSRVCGGHIQFTDISPKGGTVALTPLSYASNEGTDKVDFLHVVLLGQCRASGTDEEK